jgi:hypothetical protein
MKIDGRCHCGYVSYEAEIDPEKVMIWPLHRLPDAVGFCISYGRIHSGRYFQAAIG